MTTTINGRTPEEIKKGLECRTRWGTHDCKQKCYECDVFVPGFYGTVSKEALAYIQQLERERDAAVSDLRMLHCASCVHEDVDQEDAPCVNCRRNCGLNHYFAGEEVDNWQWRGVQEVE